MSNSTMSKHTSCVNSERSNIRCPPIDTLALQSQISEPSRDPPGVAEQPCLYVLGAAYCAGSCWPRRSRCLESGVPCCSRKSLKEGFRGCGAVFWHRASFRVQPRIPVMSRCVAWVGLVELVLYHCRCCCGFESFSCTCRGFGRC